MILGLGTDLIAVDRIRRVYANHPHRFLARTFAAAEQAYCLQAKDPSERLAGRWAAKEACMKALGTGWGAAVQFTDIIILNAATGAPALHLAGAAAKQAKCIGTTRYHVSISHADGMALATVILER